MPASAAARSEWNTTEEKKKKKKENNSKRNETLSRGFGLNNKLKDENKLSEYQHHDG